MMNAAKEARLIEKREEFRCVYWIDENGKARWECFGPGICKCDRHIRPPLKT